MTPAPTTQPFIHQIDREDRICHVNDAWRQFAADNGGTSLNENAIVGTSLWQHISGFATRHLLQLMLAKVRTRRQPIVIPFRCDSPAIRRHLEMRISPLPEEGLEFACRLLKAESRPSVAFLGAAHLRSAQSDSILMCSWCNRVSTPAWVEVEEAVRQHEMFARGPAITITHGICPDCVSGVMAEIENL